MWLLRDFKARLHFVNCHGADTDPHWFGQRGSSYPVAVDADLVASAVTPGTVVAAECCYGAQHYDPSLAGGHRGVALSYLAGGAYGVFASSTLAYGPASAMGSAVLILIVVIIIHVRHISSAPNLPCSPFGFIV